MSEQKTVPLLRILKGDPDCEELAALVGVVSALAAGTPAGTTTRPRSEWSAPYRRLRGQHRHGAGAWSASAR